jgi:hypothetical protein
MRKRLRRCIVVVVRSGYRSARAVRALLAGPHVRRGLERVVRSIGGDGENAGTLAVYVVVAAASAGGLTLASACSGLGVSESLQLAGAIVVGVAAVSAAIALVRRQRGHTEKLELRWLLTRTAARLGEQHRHVPGARTLQLACQPHALSFAARSAGPALQHVTRMACLRLASYPARRLISMLGPALELHGAYQTSLDSGRFVRHFALTALELADVSALPQVRLGTFAET